MTAIAIGFLVIKIAKSTDRNYDYPILPII